jgi:hypothetical protein
VNRPRRRIVRDGTMAALLVDDDAGLRLLQV